MTDRILTREEIRHMVLGFLRITLLSTVAPALWICIAFIGCLLTGMALIVWVAEGDARMLRGMHEFWSLETFLVWKH
jgi:hypothetical protein